MLKKTKIILLIFFSLLIIIVALALVLGAIKKKSTIQTSTTVPVYTPTSSILWKSSDSTAAKAKDILLPKLPIVVSGFDTSVGLKTDIAISSYENDAPNAVRIEIYGIDYQYDQNNPQTNPNMVAFKESFLKSISLLTANGVNVRDLHISLSNKQYVRDISETWIKTMNLLP